MGGVGLASVFATQDSLDQTAQSWFSCLAPQMRMDPHVLAMVSAITGAASAISVSLVRPVLPM